jgi:hypothetical protein
MPHNLAYTHPYIDDMFHGLPPYAGRASRRVLDRADRDPHWVEPERFEEICDNYMEEGDGE